MSIKLSFVLTDALGAPADGLVVQVKDGGGTVKASTAAGTLVDNGDGSYTTASALGNGTYLVYTGAGAGTLVPSLGALSHLDPATVPTALPVPVTEGGTGATTASAARTALGVAIGSDVQPYGATLVGWKSYCDYILGLGTTVFPYWNGSAWQYPSATSMRTALGLGTVAVEASTETGEASKVPKHTSDSAYYLAVRTSHLSAVAGNHGKMYRMIDVAGGTEGVYYIGMTGVGTYALKTIEEHVVAGA